MRQLIVNADDFGFTRGVNAGILRAFSAGILTSTTIMATGPAFEDAVELALTNPSLPVGCHLALIGGRPSAPPQTVASLIDAAGNMPATLTQLVLRLVAGRVRVADIEHEFRSQIERVLVAGIKPSHLDTHKHTHVYPPVMRALARIAREFGIKCVRNPFEGIRNARTGQLARGRRMVYLKQRVTSMAILPGIPQFRSIVDKHGLRTPDHFRGVSLTGILEGPAIQDVMRSLPEGTTELMCHPGFYDADLDRAHTRLKRERQRELDALTDPQIRNFSLSQGINLVSYAELK
jgi:hopanoid biosynthesis associated protein HpnK